MTIDFAEHPEYCEKRDDWLLYKLLFEGDQRALKSTVYLWPHELETWDRASVPAAPNSPYLEVPPGIRIRSIREQRTTYTNEVEPIVSRWQSIFFKEDPEPDKAVLALFGDDIENVTGEGKSLSTFIKDDVLVHRLLYGRPIIFTDAPAGERVSAADEKSRGLAPFFKMLHPLEVKDWELMSSGPRKGQFKWLRWQYDAIDPRANAQTAPVVTTYCKELIFEPVDEKTGTYIYNVYKLEKKDKKEGQWVQISSEQFAGYPNLPARSIEGEESWVKSTGPLALKLYNLESARDNIHLYQAHQRIFIAGNIDQTQKAAMGEYNISFLPEGAVVHTIEPVTTQSLELAIEVTRRNLRMGAFNQQRQITDNSAAVEGADTQREYKEALTTLIHSEIETLENLVNAAIKDYAWFKDKNADFNGKITFSREVDLSELTQEILFYQSLRSEIARYPTWQKETLKKFARAQNLPDVEKIVTEIDTTKVQTDPALQAEGGRQQRLQRMVNGDAKATESANNAPSEGAGNQS